MASKKDLEIYLQVHFCAIKQRNGSNLWILSRVKREPLPRVVLQVEEERRILVLKEGSAGRVLAHAVPGALSQVVRLVLIIPVGYCTLNSMTRCQSKVRITCPSLRYRYTYH
jgi:hypothetical protein